MFGFLGLSPDVVQELKGTFYRIDRLHTLLTSFHAVQYHIYMASNSRVSIAGLNDQNVEYVGRSIAECLKSK